MMSSPGSAVENATRAIAAGRTGGGSYGSGGYYGAGPGGSALKMGPLEVLTDTQGVDFGPYLERVLQAVRMNWYNLIPEEARPPLLKKGKVAIQFVILPDGKVAGMQLDLQLRRYAARPRRMGRHHRVGAIRSPAQPVSRTVPGPALPLLLQPRQRRDGVGQQLVLSSELLAPIQMRVPHPRRPLLATGWEGTLRESLSLCSCHSCRQLSSRVHYPLPRIVITSVARDLLFRRDGQTADPSSD